jgi:ABC-type sugar transport system substrate-binding protein
LGTLFCLLALAIGSAFAQTAKRIKVDYFNLLSTHEQFWDNLVGAMQAAAQQLDIDFTEHVPQPPERVTEDIERLLKSANRPNYIILTVHTGFRPEILEMTEAAKVPVFIINSGMLAADRARFGAPREHLKYWIGQMLPNDEQAGYELAKCLIESARSNKAYNAAARIEIIAITGEQGLYPTVMRNNGLQKAASESRNIDLLQIIPANFVRAQARSKIPLILKRYPDVKVIWAANDAMAMGVLSGLEDEQKQPGKDIFVGGIDWDDEAVKAVQDGRLVASVGGHFLEGAWAMVLLCDYAHGIDFASERVDWRSEMLPLTKDSVENYFKLFGAGNWRRIDFRRYSKFYNPDLKHYSFSIKPLLAQPRAAMEQP